MLDYRLKVKDKDHVFVFFTGKPEYLLHRINYSVFKLSLKRKRRRGNYYVIFIDIIVECVGLADMDRWSE